MGATAFFSQADNGYTKTWHGRVFLNPPGGSCDDQGRLVVKRSKDRPACTVSGVCGLPAGAAGHRHEGVQSSQKAWWHKLVREYVARRVEAAVFVCFSLELVQTTQVDPPSDWASPLLFPVCFPRTRVAYMSEKNGVLRPGASPTHASMIVFLPPWNDTVGAIARFEDEFVEMGLVIKGQTVSWLPAREDGRLIACAPQ